MGDMGMGMREYRDGGRRDGGWRLEDVGMGDGGIWDEGMEGWGNTEMRDEGMGDGGMENVRMEDGGMGEVNMGHRGAVRGGRWRCLWGTMALGWGSYGGH